VVRALWKPYGNGRPQQNEAESLLGADDAPSLQAPGDNR
jgi:hypothetical protein